MEINLNFSKLNGIIPVIIQDFESGKILMLGFMNEEAFQKTLETSLVHFYSRTRKKIWLKGETSKHYLRLKEIYVDCDNDTLLLKVKPEGPVCHEGYFSCFYKRFNPEKNELEIVEKKLFNPEEVYGKKG